MNLNSFARVSGGEAEPNPEQADFSDFVVLANLTGNPPLKDAVVAFALDLEQVDKESSRLQRPLSAASRSSNIWSSGSVVSMGIVGT